MKSFLPPLNSRESFTLIELLVVISIIATLTLVVIITLNPAELFKQARDSTRLSDLANINTALGLYQADGGAALGNASTTYISIPDLTATSTSGTDCSSLGLPSLPSGWVYHCAASSTYKNVNGQGWIPVNFTSISFSSPLGVLPVDPVNTTSSGNYYTYVAGGSWEMDAILESQKYRNNTNTHKNNLPGILAIGSNLSLSPIANTSGLVGYWSFDEGSGSSTLDSSGNGNNGTWSGTGSHWTTGKVGGGAGQFNGTDDYVRVSSISSAVRNLTSYSIAVWLNMANPGTNYDPVFIKENTSSSDIALFGAGSGGPESMNIQHNLNNVVTSTYATWNYTNIQANTWTHFALTYSGGTATFFTNGILRQTSIGMTDPLTDNYFLDIGYWASYPTGYRKFFSGLIDDIRVYNRALSAAEIQAIYNATK